MEEERAARTLTHAVFFAAGSFCLANDTAARIIEEFADLKCADTSYRPVFLAYMRNVSIFTAQILVIMRAASVLLSERKML
jgi:hypothetical protein